MGLRPTGSEMKRVVVVVLLLLYLLVWNAQGNKGKWADYYLSPAMPAPILQIASGFAHQMAGFGLFVKVAIFSGGPLRGVDKMSYAPALAQNFDVMAELYPDFIDIYYYGQSFLAPISPQYAKRANALMDHGIVEYPDYLYFPFFKAFNYLYYLDQPTKAAEIFFDLSKRPDAPSWFGHLAGTLMGRGGNLIAGRAMLQAMHKAEQDDFMKKRYQTSIENFDRAIEVQKALDRYRQEHGVDAATLDDLVPEYLEALPQFDAGFALAWEPPLLRLDRP